MRDEQQRVRFDRRRAKQPVVERGHNGLPGAGRHDHQILVVAMYLAFGAELVQDFPLVAPRANLQRGDLDRKVVGCDSLGAQRFTEPLALPRSGS